jgi:rRNA maturation protein Rpf1
MRAAQATASANPSRSTRSFIGHHLSLTVPQTLAAPLDPQCSLKV